MPRAIKQEGVRRTRKGLVLLNPVHITEDEADAIIATRNIEDGKDNMMPFEEYLETRGYEIVGSTRTRRIVRRRQKGVSRSGF